MILRLEKGKGGPKKKFTLELLVFMPDIDKQSENQVRKKHGEAAYAAFDVMGDRAGG